MPWSLKEGRGSIYSGKPSRARVGTGGRRLYLQRSGPNGLFLALGRHGSGYLQKGAAWLEGAWARPGLR